MKFGLGISIFILFLNLGCEKVRKIGDVVVKPSAREFYERNFKKEDSIYLQWKKSFEAAKNDDLLITLPYAESGVFSQEHFNVYSYNLQLKEGERLRVELHKSVDSTLVFIDLFQQKTDSINSLNLVKSAKNKESDLVYEINTSGNYLVIVQPEMHREIPFVLRIYSEPMYLFPVSGGSNKSIQSFWADPRDGGSRSHEGVDIFAKRGTPVLAVANGIITSTGERGLGGKQVWLSDGLFGKSVYYAHLDSITVSKGKRVKVGDTLGFVGNTGNAKTTLPHLHFGIYKNRKSVNPLPYIKLDEARKLIDTNKVQIAKIKRNSAILRKGPADVFEQAGLLYKNDTIFVLGKTSNWFHIQSLDSLKGFVPEKSTIAIPLN